MAWHPTAEGWSTDLQLSPWAWRQRRLSRTGGASPLQAGRRSKMALSGAAGGHGSSAGSGLRRRARAGSATHRWPPRPCRASPCPCRHASDRVAGGRSRGQAAALQEVPGQVRAAGRLRAGQHWSRKEVVSGCLAAPTCAVPSPPPVPAAGGGCPRAARGTRARGASAAIPHARGCRWRLRRCWCWCWWEPAARAPPPLPPGRRPAAAACGQRQLQLVAISPLSTERHAASVGYGSRMQRAQRCQ